MCLAVGLASFGLFIWFDCRKAAGKSGGALFAAGMCLLMGATAGLLFPLAPGRWVFRLLGAVCAVMGLGSLVYVLFFALPSEEVYIGQDAPEVCTVGVYALCRHPGMWSFLLLYLGLWLLAGTQSMGMGAVLFSAADLAYIILQDRILFPRYIRGYESYRRETPFLFPTRQSIRACWDTLITH